MGPRDDRLSRGTRPSPAGGAAVADTCFSSAWPARRVDSVDLEFDQGASSLCTRRTRDRQCELISSACAPLRSDGRALIEGATSLVQ